MLKLRLIALTLGAMLCLNACTLDDETNDTNLIIESSEQVEDNLSAMQKDFALLLDNYLNQNADNIDEIVNIYFSSLTEADLDKTQRALLTEHEMTAPLYHFQTEELTRLFLLCLQKAPHLKDKFYVDFTITKGSAIARIANHFYEENDLVNGAFWSKLALDLFGLNQGYYALGRVFFVSDKNKGMGVRLLAEAAKLGNTDAQQLLSDSIYQNNVFKEYQKAQKILSTAKD